MEELREPGPFKDPVKWLLGRKLLLDLRWVIFTGVLGDRWGGVDWMTATTHEELSDGDELWFDYLADTGDGQWATYRAATGCLSDLWLTGAERVLDMEEDGAKRLPRGQFLLIGSDLAYPTANLETLRERLEIPFRWAQRALTGRPSVERPSRLYAIPGNHDYYDALRGFSRVVRKPGHDVESLLVGGFSSEQQSSYFTIRLPFGWWLFAVDAQKGRIDARQRAFFNGVIDEQRARGQPVEKLIVATPEPTTAFGRLARERGEGEEGGDEIVQTLTAIQVEVPFVKGGKLERERCRLDLSGNFHHYARYWGPPAKGEDERRPDRSESYASVQSGLGGAFLHPSHTRLGDEAPAALYPAVEVSRERTNRALLDPFTMMLTGNVWFAGALVAVILWIAARTPGTQELIEALLSALGHLPRAGALVDAAGASPWTGAFAFVIAVATAVLAVGAAWSVRWVQWSDTRLARRLGAPPLLACAALGLSLWVVVARAPGPHGVFSSVALLLFLLAHALTLYVGVASGQLFSDRAGRWTGLASPVGVLLSLGVFGSAWAAIHCFGQQPVALVGVHWAFAAVVLLGVLGLPLFAWSAGASRRRWPARVGFLALGLLHAALQLGTPLSWVRSGSPVGVLAAIGVAGVGALIGLRVTRAGGDRPLVWTALWVVTGSLVLSMPFVFPAEVARNDWSRLVLLAPVGALFSAIWFGWYLVVSLAFNGHNNEAGSAARIDQFVEFVRIRLTAGGLEAYVIAIEGDRRAPRKLRFKLVDRFKLIPQRAPARDGGSSPL
ncbi:hypothetical protein WME90_11150 [Sorangium sp. So ce375]|uniref:hypothetical protein n=1 Tax=Sorangium sp. So ce375 TaxID=3133306 RepID=UPI003F5B9A24